jgi:hypothetical protein
MSIARTGGAFLVLLVGCHGPSSNGADATGSIDAAVIDVPVDSPACTGTRPECAALWEQTASDRFDGLLGDPVGLKAFLKGAPKGGDLHNHLSGAVYAETYLQWAADDNDCINSSTEAAVSGSSCSATNVAVPASGTFFDTIVRAWSMQDFVAASESGHDHFFATFGKYGLVAGAHRDDTIADVLMRAADENQVYVETMFNLAKNTGTLTANKWSGTLTAADLSGLYDMVVQDAGFATAITNDVNVVTSATAGYRSTLGCDGANPPPACGVGVRFIAQVSRTGASDQVFGQLIGAYEMASRTGQIVGANLSSPEDDSASIANYDLHMAMLDFLHTKYAGTSPLHVTLHAGELSSAYLPSGSTANTFHIRSAVETGHAERIGHGLDVMSETDPEGLMTEMAANNVLVEVCLSSNVQILEVSGTDHPLAQYLAHGVPVALATDDQGVSRSSMAGEYVRAALDQHLTYRQIKTLARNSLEHAFLPGTSLWTAVGQPVAACAATDTMALGDPANATCAAYLAASERATAQWELERRFLAFESKQ